MRRSLVSFDLDGTLVDLRAVYVVAHQFAARKVLRRELDEAQVLQLMQTGMPIKAHMALLDQAVADQLVEVFVDRYRIEREGLVQPFPGMLELVRALRGDGVPIAVVTSKLRDDALVELSATGLLDEIDVLVGFEDTEAHKPAPTPHLAALEAVGAADGVGVGDLPTDIVSARAAGLAAVAVSWGYGSRVALLEAGAECICDNAAELEREVRARLAPARSSADKEPASERWRPTR